ncbi:uncharacterized protein LOC125552059 [Triticum urartu]|uniref:uncharacterized protein LOC125552059 n=1 Tax=Triticum urartu TaxID=4572 RepID=UPI002043635B|nr:uncharacterized protein LOC125552059 [Triticum urartu]
MRGLPPRALSRDAAIHAIELRPRRCRHLRPMTSSSVKVSPLSLSLIASDLGFSCRQMCGRGEKEDWDAGIISGRRCASATAATLASTDDVMEQVKTQHLHFFPCTFLLRKQRNLGFRNGRST